MASEHHPGGAGDQQVVGAADVRAEEHVPDPVRDRLAARTREILERPRPAASEEQVAREKAVVHECRYLMRLLSTRRRTDGEMRLRLSEREVPADVAHEVMARIDRA